MECQEINGPQMGKTVAGALLLGVLGNACWEGVKAWAFWSSHQFLNIITFGFDGLQNSIYREIARGNHDGSAQWALTLLLVIYISVECESYIRAMDRQHQLEQLFRSKNLLPAVPVSKEAQDNPIVWASNVIKDLNKMTKKRVFLTLAILLWQTLNIITITYENGKIARYEQFLAIASPYMSEQSRLEYRSRFAQIKSVNDYDKILDQLGKIQIPTTNAQ